MTVDVPSALQTLEGGSLESDCEQDVALAMRATFFVDVRHGACGWSLFSYPRLVQGCVFRLSRLLLCCARGLSAWLISPNENFLYHPDRVCQGIFGGIRNFLSDWSCRACVHGGIRNSKSILTQGVSDILP